MTSVSYASIVGSLMYVMVYTKPDTTHAVRVFSKYMTNAGTEH